MVQIWASTRVNPVKERLRDDILKVLRDVPLGYRAGYIIYLLNGGSTLELIYSEKQINQMLDNMVKDGYLRIEQGNFKSVLA